MNDENVTITATAARRGKFLCFTTGDDQPFCMTFGVMKKAGWLYHVFRVNDGPWEQNLRELPIPNYE